MGGVAGHMNHIYDNPSLTFKEIKDIFNLASSGNLTGTEKTDGINLFLSYSIKEGKAKAARNKGNIKSGGLDADQLAAKFSDRGSLTNTFQNAFNSWSETVNKLDSETKIKLFGNDANIFYNVEIQDPSSPNVINYDDNNLVIHPSGHIAINKETGQIEDIDIGVNYSFLTSELKKQQNDELGGTNFKVVANNIRTLKALSDKRSLKIALSRLQKLQSSVRARDEDTIGDFVTKVLFFQLKRQVPGLTNGTMSAIANKILGLKGLNINKILEKVPDEYKEKVREIANNAGPTLKAIIAPLEDIIHDYSVEVLKGLESAFILDNDKEVKRLRQEVASAIKAIEGSGQEEAIKILSTQLRKLKKADNVYTAAEGFVFDYNGITYKFTGNFAPINQILGLFKFGRGNIPPLQHLMKESDKNRIIAILPGAYKPPHVAHFAAAQYFANVNNVDEVRIIISPVSREDVGGKIAITADMSFKIWNIYAKNQPKLKIIKSLNSSPVREVYDMIKTVNPGDTILLGKGEKETEKDTRFKLAQDWADKNNTNVKVTPVITRIDSKLSKISASKLREYVAQGQKDKFLLFVPKHLSAEEKEQVWNIVSKQSKSNQTNNDYPSDEGVKHKKVVQQFKNMKKQDLSEMSAMGAGAVAGSTQPIKNKEEKTKFISRGRMVENLLLREHIRSIINKVYHKRINENAELREFVRKFIISEAKANISDTNHSSTGINVLEDVLKKIIPQMEQDYKSLTSNEQQRESFRSHILNAVSKSLSSADINGDAEGGDESARLAEDYTGTILDSSLSTEEVAIEVGDESVGGEQDKFIDINKKSSDEEEEDTFSIAGKDVTGRNMSQMTYDKIEKNILDSYSVLSDPEDKKLFYDYLLTNLKLYFDKFESELETDLKEPEVDASSGEDTSTGDGAMGAEEAPPEEEMFEEPMGNDIFSYDD